MCTAFFVNHDPGLPTADADIPTIKEAIGAMLAAFPDLQSSDEDLIAAGETVVVRRTMRGTHRGEFIGIAPTGNPVKFGGMWLTRLNDGRLRDQWVSFDALGLLRQLGAISAPD